MRVFIAVELPQQVKKEIAAIQNKITDTTNKIKWVSPASMHITLKFLGEVQEKRLDKVFDISQGVADKFNPFSVEIKGTGAFPETGNPKVLWVGIKEGSAELARMAAELEKELFKDGFPGERKKWTPHITLGRVKQLKDTHSIKELIGKEKETSGGKMKVEEIVVLQSQLTPQGAIHTPLKRFSLKKD
ncbi:RNA 2',3'-cyclic phosphodiesterase [Candidatus Aerophobetes bacterium]|nr:RNA 2',3'-cyclic phosphodiesterase [Candidatus Aerophobetes bacterium]